MRYLFIGLLSLLVSCTGLPDGVEPVTGFDKQRYLGTWHEIARLDHSFERGLEQVTATYAVRDDGAISVLNRGYDIEDQQWRQAEGVAKPVSSDDVAHLKVSFFGPFYGTYAVFELADDYSHAFVAGFNTDYLWLLLVNQPYPKRCDSALSPELMNSVSMSTRSSGWMAVSGHKKATQTRV